MVDVTGSEPARMQVVAHLDRATAIRSTVFSGGTPPAPFAVITIGASAGRVELLVDDPGDLRRLRVALESVERALASSLTQWRTEQQTLGVASDGRADPEMTAGVPMPAALGGGR